ncbi:MAG: DUF4166 domain-containing protein, partial [Bacilli bacterium]
MMASIYERVLGEKFSSLHPQLQKKFGLRSDSKRAVVCTGVMDEIWGGKFLMRPFLMAGALKRLTFAERGKNIPFTLENYAYKNGNGNECVAWLRNFHFSHVRHFDATMMRSEKDESIVD